MCEHKRLFCIIGSTEVIATILMLLATMPSEFIPILACGTLQPVTTHVTASNYNRANDVMCVCVCVPVCVCACVATDS